MSQNQTEGVTTKQLARLLGIKEGTVISMSNQRTFPSEARKRIQRVWWHYPSIKAWRDERAKRKAYVNRRSLDAHE